ncbi:MAG: SAM hydrolase/SAM-dependent halogenase family protein [Candidatus Polarisedimenticolia bacterium]
MLITLLTDFGTRDHYVASVKAGILLVAPGATLVDITHDVPAHDVLEGAWTLGNAFPDFPAGTVHLAVVDPGVGTSRRGMALAAGGQLLVGPDNGLFSYVLDRHPASAMVELPIAEGDAVSPVFHGRDLFAPAAARLATGADIRSLGPPLHDPVLLTVPRPSTAAGGVVRAHVAHIDRFGNVVLYATPADLPVPVRARAGARVVSLFVRTYGDAPPGEPAILINSSGFLEIGANGARAADLLGLQRGDVVDLT